MKFIGVKVFFKSICWGGGGGANDEFLPSSSQNVGNILELSGKNKNNDTQNF